MATVLARTTLRSLAWVRTAHDRWWVPFWLRQLGLEMGTGCQFAGMPCIHIAPGASIRLGNDVKIFSRASCNPRGIPHPSIIWALEPGAQVIIGDNVRMTGVSMSVRSVLTIGDHVQIGPGACLWDSDGHALRPELRMMGETPDMVRRAPIVIKDNAFIGARAIILKGVTIGESAIVGAGALVTKDVFPCEIVGGNPARVIGSLN